MNGYHYKTMNEQSESIALKEEEKPRLRDFLAEDCSEIMRRGEVGYTSENRPGVRLVNSEHISGLNYHKAL